MEIKSVINFEDFEKLDLRAGKILEAERVEGSDKLLKLQMIWGKKRGRYWPESAGLFSRGID
jgi:tRNA-binding EMAP/Myf-like protein